MATVVREVVEGTQLQGADEAIIYKITTTNWATGATTANASAYYDNDGTWTSVASTVFVAGSCSVSSNVITLPILDNLTADELYRVEVQFSASGNTYEPYFYVQAER